MELIRLHGMFGESYVGFSTRENIFGRTTAFNVDVDYNGVYIVKARG